MLTVACVQVGNYLGRGHEYVNKLADMVARNLETPHRFVCLTDDPSGLARGIETIPATETGWWAKLELFRELKGQTLFLDLDTIITGPLEPFTEYAGRFACLRDFYRPEGLGSGVMAWNGDLSCVWERWVAEGKPRPKGGDQAFLETVLPDADRLQKLYPNLIKSYKRDGWPDAGTSLVCFHGNPRPHAVDDEWVKDIWTIGGLARPRFYSSLNTPASVLSLQTRENLSRDTPLLLGRPEHREEVAVIAGGPSLKHNIPKIRKLYDRGVQIWALNGTHDWLLDRGITPHAMVILDGRAENRQFVTRSSPKTTYYVASQCHPEVFEALKGKTVVQWVQWMPDAEDIADEFPDKPIVLVGGGNTVGLKALCVAYILGYRTMHLFGFDSCYSGDENHAYRQPMNDGEAIITIVCAGKTFKCARWMAKQAHDFQDQAKNLLNMGVTLKVHGDGLIPWIARQWS